MFTIPPETLHQPIDAVPDIKNASAGEVALRRYFDEEAASLLGAMRVFVSRRGLDRREGREEAALELLNDVFLEAMKRPQRFDPDKGGAYSWLMGIAANMMKRRQRSDGQDRARYVHESDFQCDFQGEDRVDNGDFFDRVATISAEVRHMPSEQAPESALENHEAARALLALVSSGDARVLRLAILNEISGERLAFHLGVSPVNARVKLHRALKNLRDAYKKQHGVENHV